MPGSRRAKKGQTGSGKNSEAPMGKMWDKKSVQEFDGRKNTQSGDKGKEPGGRWGPAYYEGAPVVISRHNVRKP